MCRNGPAQIRMTARLKMLTDRGFLGKPRTDSGARMPHTQTCMGTTGAYRSRARASLRRVATDMSPCTKVCALCMALPCSCLPKLPKPPGSALGAQRSVCNVRDCDTALISLFVPLVPPHHHHHPIIHIVETAERPGTRQSNTTGGGNWHSCLTTSEF